MRALVTRSLFWMVAFLSSWSVLVAQKPAKDASIMLTVKDQTGVNIPGANVEILSIADGEGKELTTNADGKLSIDVPSGMYDLVVKSLGFLPQTQHLEVNDGSPQTIDIVLRVGEAWPGSSTTNPLLVSFPEHSRAVSPDGNYALVGVDSDAEPQHTVFLEDLSLKTRRKLFNYSRHVLVLWNSSSKIFAVTDYMGRDKSRCSIFSVDGSLPVIDAQEEILNQLFETARKDLRNLLSNQQAFVEASMWLGPMELEIKVWGYRNTDHSGFTEYYLLHAHFGAAQSRIISPMIPVTPKPDTRSPLLGN